MVVLVISSQLYGGLNDVNLRADDETCTDGTSNSNHSNLTGGQVSVQMVVGIGGQIVSICDVDIVIGLPLGRPLRGVVVGVDVGGHLDQNRWRGIVRSWGGRLIESEKGVREMTTAMLE